MLSRHVHGQVTWIDLENPTREEVADVMKEYGLDHSVAEELLLPTTKPRVEFHQGYLYAILHFPALRHSHSTSEQEVDFVVGVDFIITTHYDSIDPLHKFSKSMEVDSLLEKDTLGEHGNYLFFFMLERLYSAVEHELDFVRTDILHVEQHIFSGREVHMVRAISRCARDLLHMRQTIEPHRDILKSLQEEGTNFFGKEFLPFVRVLENDYYRLHNHIVRFSESLRELRETNNSLLSTKEGETMRVLTLMALLTFPLSLVVAIFDINAVHNPIVGRPYDFWIIVSIVAAAGVSMIWYFRHRGWL